jgi:hypothetical protein
VIIKHIVELETVILDNSNEPSVLAIKAMSEQERQQFFTEAGTSLVARMLGNVNEGNSWAVLRIAEKESV